MATSRNKQLWYLWLARDERQPQPKNQDELEPYGRLHVFYDSPILENGEWRWLGKDSYTNWMSIPELLK